MINKIDENKRSDFIFQSFSNLNGQRIVSIALPFLALNSKTAALSSFGVGFYQCYTLWNTTPDKTTTGSKWGDAALLVTTATLGYFFPVHQLIFSNGVFFATHLYKLIIKRENTALQIIHQAIHVSSIYYGTPALIVLSLVSQASSEFIQACQQHKDRKYPEMIASCTLAALRLYKASSYLPKDFVFTNAKEADLPPSIKQEEQEVPIPVIEEDQTAEIIAPPQQPLKKLIKQEEQEIPVIEEGQTVAAAASPQQETPQPPLKKLTQDDWDNLRYKLPGHTYGRFQDAMQVPVTNFAVFLNKEGFLTEIEGLEIKDFDFNNCLLQDIKFKHCEFSYSRFSDCSFSQVTAEGCNFKKSCWENSLIQNSIFTDSSFEKAYFKFSSFKNSLFTGCDFYSSTTYKSFYENMTLAGCGLMQSNWTGTSFDQVVLQEAKLTESSFLQASVKNSRLIDCDLKDALLLDAKEGFEITGGTPHEITKPIVALGWHFGGSGAYTSLIRKALRDNDSLVLLYEQKTIKQSFFNNSLLNSEVREALEKALPSQQSIGQQLVENALPNSEIDQLNQTAKEILKYASGLIIPGGEDIEPFFYDCTVKQGEFKYRTVLELALLAEANRQKIPTMGICRGAQIINVFFGGTLLEDVDGQHGVHQLEWTKSSQRENLRNILPEEFNALSMHHQAVDQVGKGLNVVLKLGQIPKILLSDDGNFIASQVHPEDYIDEQKVIAASLKMERLTKEDFDTIKKINSSFRENAQALQNQYPASTLAAHRYFEVIDKSILEITKTLDYVISNKNIYRFFLDKVERFRNQTHLQSSA